MDECQYNISDCDLNANCTHTVLTNALVKRDTLAMDTHIQVHLIFITQDDQEFVFPLTVLAHSYARSSHNFECSNKAEFIVLT